MNIISKSEFNLSNVAKETNKDKSPRSRICFGKTNGGESKIESMNVNFDEIEQKLLNFE